MTLGELYMQAMGKLDLPAFLTALGAVVPPPEQRVADTDWQTVTIKETKYEINLKDGDWRLLEDAEKRTQSLLELVRRQRKYTRAEGKVQALGEVCRAAGMLNELRALEEAQPKPQADDETAPVIVLRSLAELDKPELLNKHVAVPVRIAATSSVAYDSPTEFGVSCPDDGRCVKCLGATFTIKPTHPIHVAAWKVREDVRQGLMRAIIQCRRGRRIDTVVTKSSTFRELVVATHVLRTEVVKDTKGRPSAILDGRREEAVERRAYIHMHPEQPVPQELVSYTARGWIRTNPYNLTRTLLVEDLQPLTVGFRAWKFADDYARLEKLRTLGLPALLHDLEQHRTRIYGRRDLLLAMLLTYCSALWLRFNVEQIRGWLTTGVIWDTATGKNDTFRALLKMVGEGDMFCCQTGSRTGLLFATVQRNDGAWQCQAGALPRADEKILCIDEVQDLDADDLKKVTVAMDSGALQPENVARGAYDTRTRLVYLANAQHKRVLGSFAHGCLAFRDLFHPNFSRRLDIGMVIRAKPEDTEYNRYFQPAAEPIVEDADLRALVYYAWTLTDDKIVIADDVTRHILESAKQLGERFGGCDDLQLVCPADCRKTVARIAVAFAVLHVAASPDGTLTVSHEHVQEAVEFLGRIYSTTDCALDTYSDYYKRYNRMDDYHAVKEALLARLRQPDSDGASGDPFGMLLFILQRGPMDLGDLRIDLACSERWLAAALGIVRAHGLVKLEKGRVVPAQKMARVMTRLASEESVVGEIMGTAEADHASGEGRHRRKRDGQAG